MAREADIPDAINHFHMAGYIDFAELHEAIQKKWPVYSMDDILLEPITEKVRGCGCHSEPGDYEPFLRIENTAISNAIREIEVGLRAYWTEDGSAITEADLPRIQEEAERLMFERGLGRYNDGIKARLNGERIYLLPFGA